MIRHINWSHFWGALRSLQFHSPVFARSTQFSPNSSKPSPFIAVSTHAPIVEHYALVLKVKSTSRDFEKSSPNSSYFISNLVSYCAVSSNKFVIFITQYSKFITEIHQTKHLRIFHQLKIDIQAVRQEILLYQGTNFLCALRAMEQRN